MAEFRSAVVTDLGAELLARSVAEGFKVEFIRLEIGCGIYDEDEKKKEALKKRTGLKEKQQEIGFSNISVTDENAVMLKAVVSNEALETGYYMTEIGVIAKKEGAEDEVLYSAMIAEVPDFMPGKENPMEVIQEYHSKITNAENVVINVEQGAYATAEDMQSVLKPQFKENEEIENIESGESIFSIFAKIKRAIRGLIEHKTSGDHDSRYYTETEMDGKLSGKSDTTHNHDGRYLQKSAVINSNTVTEAGYALDARQANPNVSGSLGAQINSLNTNLVPSIIAFTQTDEMKNIFQINTWTILKTGNVLKLYLHVTAKMYCSDAWAICELKNLSRNISTTQFFEIRKHNSSVSMIGAFGSGNIISTLNGVNQGDVLICDTVLIL